MADIPFDLARHPIGVVVRRTGLKPDLIRAWERRYAAVEPSRSATGRRLYSDLDIERLVLLRQAVQAGRGISHAAALDKEQLRTLIREDRPNPGPARLPPADLWNGQVTAEAVLASCISAVERLDVIELELQLERAAVALSQIHMIERVLVPMMHSIGDLWQQGTLRPSHEHMASAVIRSFLGEMRSAYQPPSQAPHLIVTTPARQHHELGALIAAATAATEGWSIVYLGPDLPPEDIAAAAHQRGAKAVALSITFPPDDSRLADDLRRLRRMLDPRIQVVVGGRSAGHYEPVLKEIGAHSVADLTEFRRALAKLRVPSSV
ncbi:MAG: cobalamin B12-binding domain-containing protein [Acidobacteriota bacterium]